MDAETVTRFWLQAGVADGVGLGAAEADAGADPEGVGAAVAEAALLAGSVDEACSDPPNRPAIANPLTTRAITISNAPPTTSRRRR